MKKIVSILLVLALIFTQMSFTVMADEEKEIEFQNVLVEDFSTMKDVTTPKYQIPTDASGKPTSRDAIRIGETDMYLNPPISTTASVFDKPEIAYISSGALKFTQSREAGYSTSPERECRFVWQPEGYSEMKNTYRITVSGKGANKNSGFILRFHSDDDASNCYMLVIHSCVYDKDAPGWELYKRVDGKDTSLLKSSFVSKQVASGGNGYYRTFTAEVSVVDKKDITVHMTGTTSNSKKVNETFTYTDETPFEHDISDNYIHVVPFGGALDVFRLQFAQVAKPTTKSSVIRDDDNFTINTNYEFCETGKTYVCGYKDGRLISSTSRAYTKDTEEFNLKGDFDTVKVFMWDNDYKPLTKPEVFSVPDKVPYTLLASADFEGQTASPTVYKIDIDSEDYPLYDDPVHIGTTDFYQTPPISEIDRVFAGDVDEKASLQANALRLIGGYASLGGYAERECRTEWRPANYKDVTNTYRLKFSGRVTSSLSGFAARFQCNERGTSYYQFAVNSCSKSSGSPAWTLIRKNASANEKVIASSKVMPTQSTSGNGYLQDFNVSIAVVDKSKFTLVITGKTSTGKDFKELTTVTDDEPMDQDAHDGYVHFKCYGSATSTVDLYSVSLETDPNAEAVGYKSPLPDYGTVTTAETNKMTWKEFDKGYLTVIFDDNNDNLEPMFNIVTGEFGFPICSAVPTMYINRNPISLLQKIQASGGEIISHTVNHPQLNSKSSWTNVDNEFKTSYDQLTAAGLNINGIILAGGANSDTSEYFGKMVEPITAKYYKYSDLYGVSPQYRKRRASFSGMTTSQIKAIIDRVIRNKSWITIYAHSFSEFPESIMREVFAYAKEKQEEGVFDIATYRTIYKNFAEFENPVDWGKDVYKVKFYGTDNKTLIGTATVTEGDTAVAPTEYVPAAGYTFDRWSESLENASKNMSVYAICKDSQGAEVSTTHENVMVKTYDRNNPVLANTKKKIVNSNALNVCYLGGTTKTNTVEQTVNDWLTGNFSGISLTSTNKGYVGASSFSTALLMSQINQGNSADLVVVDLTNNDKASCPSNYIWSKFDIKRQAEHIVREIYAANSNADIVFVVDGKGNGTGSYEAYTEIAEEYKATGIGVLDLNGVEPSSYENTVDEFLTEYLKTVYVRPDEEIDNHYNKMPEDYVMRSPMLKITPILASEFTTNAITTSGGAINTNMLDNTQNSIEILDSSATFGANAAASFNFTGTGFGLAVGATTEDATLKYQIDGHGWKEVTIEANNGGIIIPLENELSYYEHTIDLEFVDSITVGGAFTYGVDNGLANITALSIDDGPTEASTEQIVNVLKKNDAHATFFMVGYKIKGSSGISDSTRFLLNRILEEGSEIGNHSNSTSGCTNVNDYKDAFQTMQNKVFEAVGVYPTVLRSPGNDNADYVFEATPLPLMNGYNIGVDWNAPNAGGTDVENRISKITSNAEDGRIILMHDNIYGAEALETALPNIAKKGLKVVSVSELIKLRGYVVPNMRQYRAFYKTGPEIFAQHSSLGPVQN